MIVLETERLYLREWVPDDWVRFKPLVVDPRVIEYVHQGEPCTDDRIENRVREYIHFGQTRGWHLWPVIHRADSRLIGFCGFSDGFPPDVEIGWRLLGNDHDPSGCLLGLQPACVGQRELSASGSSGQLRIAELMSEHFEE